LKFAVGRLSQWNNHSNKAPAAKLKCLIDFVKAIQAMLSETAKDGNPDGADILLPCTIYALLQLSPQQSPHIKSNLEYIRLFRHQDRLDGQDEYYLTNLESAAAFIYEMGPKDLSMDSQEYEAFLANPSSAQ
jgi:hypothetical protein